MEMDDLKKSDSVIVAMKPANKGSSGLAESGERRAGPKGIREAKARAALRSGEARHRRPTGYDKLQRGTRKSVLLRFSTTSRRMR